MKKIFMILSSATLVLALNSCNNAEEAKKLAEEQNAKIQAAVDEKLNALSAEVAAECDSIVLAQAQPVVDSLLAAAAKAKGKPAPKPKPKPKPEEPKKEEPKTGLGAGKIGSESSKPAQIGEGKVGTEKSNQDSKLGKGKLGTQPK